MRTKQSRVFDVGIIEARKQGIEQGRQFERERIREELEKKLVKLKDGCIVNGVIIGSDDVGHIINLVCGKGKVKQA